MSARILVVDDVPANVKLLEARLSAEYFDVLTATDGAEALDICSRAECDIILLDVMMPDMDGFEVCRRLKSNPATPFIPVVIITALDSPSDRVRGLRARAPGRRMVVYAVGAAGDARGARSAAAGLVVRGDLGRAAVLVAAAADESPPVTISVHLQQGGPAGRVPGGPLLAGRRASPLLP